MPPSKWNSLSFPCALVVEADGDAGVEEGELAEALRQAVVAEVEDFEDRGVGPEGDGRPGLVGGSDLFELGRDFSPLVGLAVDLSVPADLELEPLRERVHHGDSDTVETGGELVGLVVELSPGVELGHHDFGGGPSRLLLDVDGNAAAVVDDGHAVVNVKGDLDPVQ